MKKTFDRTQISVRCALCGKGAVMSYNRPHSQKHTKRLVKPNIQSFYGIPVCTRCLRTIKADKGAGNFLKKSTTEAVAATVAAESVEQ
jgi:ribosomal protein L28